MQKKRTVARAARVLFVVGAVVVAGGSLAADQASGARAQARAIEGVWEPTVTIRDCQTEAPLFSFLSMDSYIRGGSLVAESASQPFERATGLGTWRHAGGPNFTSAFQFFTYAPDGTPAGRLKGSTHIRLGADGKSFRSNETFEVSDLNGTVILQGCGTREAIRLQ